MGAPKMNKNAVGNEGGRPKESIDKVKKGLPKDWKKIIVNLFTEGASKTEVLAELGIGKYAFERLIEEDVEFSNTIKRNLELAEAWWLKKGRTNLENKKFSPVLWYMNMKNRFGWRDNNNVDITSGGEKLGNIVLPAMQPVWPAPIKDEKPNRTY